MLSKWHFCSLKTRVEWSFVFVRVTCEVASGPSRHRHVSWLSPNAFAPVARLNIPLSACLDVFLLSRPPSHYFARLPGKAVLAVRLRECRRDVRSPCVRRAHSALSQHDDHAREAPGVSVVLFSAGGHPAPSTLPWKQSNILRGYPQVPRLPSSSVLQEAFIVPLLGDTYTKPDV